MNHTELLARDVAALHAARTAGTWRLLPAETALAVDLARGQWTGPFLRAGLRQGGAALAEGPLHGVLETAVAVLEGPGAADRPVAEALACLRNLVDVLADEQEPVA